VNLLPGVYTLGYLHHAPAGLSKSACFLICPFLKEHSVYGFKFKGFIISIPIQTVNDYKACGGGFEALY
jgi:hypothetical protein